MTTLVDPDRQNRFVWAVLVVVGAALCIAGWYRWMM